jgi:hypothetical protein
MLAQTMLEQVIGGAEYGGGAGRTPPRTPSCATCVLLSMFLASALWAQKAKPLPIALKDGVATIEGRLRGRQQTDYESEIGPPTTLTLQLLAAPSKTVALKVYTPEGNEMPLRVGGANVWTADLPRGGDYGISVLRTSHERGTSTYKLTVRIR